MVIRRVSVFSKDYKGGNKAAVVVETTKLTDEIRQHMATQIGYSETVFLKSQKTGIFFARFFTPTQEVDMCGHASIAAYAVLKKEGTVKSEGAFVMETKAGKIELHEEEERVFLQMPRAKIVRKLDRKDSQRLRQIMSPSQFCQSEESYPIVQCGLADIMFRTKSQEELNNLCPDFEGMKELSREQGVVGVHAYFFEPEQMRIYARNFAPLYEIEEEAATGTSNAGLAFFLWNKGDQLQNKCYEIIQGEAMGAPSLIEARVELTNHKPICYVGGLIRYMSE